MAGLLTALSSAAKAFAGGLISSPAVPRSETPADPVVSMLLGARDAKESGAYDNRLKLNYALLRTMSRTDPDTWAIINKYKTRITKMGWDCVPDLGAIKAQLSMWEREAMLWVSPYADTSFKPSFDGTALPSSVGGPLRSAILKIDKADVVAASRRIRWYIRQAAWELSKPLVKTSQIAKQKLSLINDDDDNPMDTLIECLLDDILVIDSAGIGIRPDMAGELYDGWRVKGERIVPLRNEDGTRPKPPAVAYREKLDGRTLAEYVTDFRKVSGGEAKALVRIVANPTGNGYGFSPLEAVAYVICGSLHADSFNLEKFAGNIPPAIVALGSKLSDTQLKRFKQEWDGDVIGRSAGRHKIAFLNADKDAIGKIGMTGEIKNDGEWTEYRKWTFGIKCACYQLSPLDLGLTADFHRTTAETTKQISSEGIEDTACMLEKAFTEGLIQRGMGISGVQFRFRRDETLDTKERAERDEIRIRIGTKTINESRQDIGLPDLPVGGDTAILFTPRMVVPVGKIDEGFTEENNVASIRGKGNASADDLENDSSEGDGHAFDGKRSKAKKPSPTQKEIETMKKTIEGLRAGKKDRQAAFAATEKAIEDAERARRTAAEATVKEALKGKT